MQGVVLLPLLVAVCWAAVPQDEIKMLPGLRKQPYWKQYSGYLQATGTRKLHYWFVESQNNPKTDPVVLWLNGGPGCSSDLGLLTENGPFRIMPDGKTVVYSKTSWSSIANMIFLESPAGVGFSYSKDKNYTTDDDQVAMDNYVALKDFFQKFKEYRKNEFFITGESYGGVYVPTLSSLVVDDPSFNFVGFAVGNGLSDDKKNDNSLIYFAYYHGLIGDREWMDLSKFCCNGQMIRCDFTSQTNVNCKMAVNKVSTIVYQSGLNIYNLYGECAGGVGNKRTYFDETTNKAKSSNFGWPLSFLPSLQNERKLMKTIPANRLTLTPPCIDAHQVIEYLNTPAVRTALHIPPDLPAWETCSVNVSLGYKKIYPDMLAQYRKVLKNGKRVLVYNGDIDMACNFLGDEWFVDGLKLDMKEARREWFYRAKDGTKQVAGFIKTFENLQLVTVRGAGHMVPTDRPVPGLDMFTSFIKNTRL